MVMSRDYGQYCGLARSLDVVGDRWNLLIVRQLLMGPARYGELREGLSGIATNLLTDRLRDLETAGVIERQLSGDSSAITYALTEWGAQLREPINALVRWSTPLMIRGPENDEFRPNGSWWLSPPCSRGACPPITRRRWGSSSMVRWSNYEPPSPGSSSAIPTDESLPPSSPPMLILSWALRQACCLWMTSERSSTLTVTSPPCGVF